jgi:hypothetical protein
MTLNFAKVMAGAKQRQAMVLNLFAQTLPHSMNCDGAHVRQLRREFIEQSRGQNVPEAVAQWQTYTLDKLTERRKKQMSSIPVFGFTITVCIAIAVFSPQRISNGSTTTTLLSLEAHLLSSSR